MRNGMRVHLFLLVIASAIPVFSQEQPAKTPPQETPDEGEDPFGMDETESPSNKAANKVDNWKVTADQVGAEKVEGRIGADRVGLLNDAPYVLLPSRPFYSRYGSGRLHVPIDNDLPGFTFGDVVIRPMGDVTGTYNDKTVGDDADFLTRYAPGVALTFQPNRQFSLDASYTFAWNDYAEDKAKDFLEHDASVAFTIRDAGISDLNFRIYDHYGQTANVGQFNGEVQFQLDNGTFQSFGTLEVWRAFQRVQNNTAGMLATYRTGMYSMEGSYEYSLTDYFSRLFDSNDTTTHTARASVAFNHYTQFRPFVAYAFDHIGLTHRSSRGTDAHTFTFGTTIDITSELNAYINLTPRSVINLDSHRYTNDLIVDSGLIWQLNKKIQMVYSFNGGVEDRENANSSRLLGCGISMTANIIRDLDFGAYASFRNTKVQAGPTTQTNLYGLRVDYRIHRYLRMYGLYNRSDSWSHDGGSSQHGDQNLGTLGFSARF